MARRENRDTERDIRAMDRRLSRLSNSRGSLPSPAERREQSLSRNRAVKREQEELFKRRPLDGGDSPALYFARARVREKLAARDALNALHHRKAGGVAR